MASKTFEIVTFGSGATLGPDPVERVDADGYEFKKDPTKDPMVQQSSHPFVSFFVYESLQAPEGCRLVTREVVAYRAATIKKIKEVR